MVQSEGGCEITEDNPASETKSVLWKVAIDKGLRNTTQMCGTVLSYLCSNEYSCLGTVSNYVAICHDFIFKTFVNFN